MATFNYTVDTEPMAQEMSSVSKHVNVTTGAVVAMQAAVIAAENKAADHVCENVNMGFYTLIRSQISQKLAKLQSEVDSHLMQMNQQRRALEAIRFRMERDYKMIAGRYHKLFNGLNSNLKQRIFELDKPTIDFACKEIDKVSNRTKYLTATVPITQLESISSSQQIISSNLKLRGFNVIHSMKRFIHEMNVQKKLTDQILINDINITPLGKSYIPIILLEATTLKDSQTIDVVMVQEQLTEISKNAIRKLAFDEFTSMRWIDNDNDTEVSNYFGSLVSRASGSKRVNDLAFKLYQANRYQTIKTGAL